MAFEYQYMMLRVSATLTDALAVKQGLRTLTAPLDAIDGFYVTRQGAGDRSFDELIVSYRKPGKDKPAILRTWANGIAVLILGTVAVVMAVKLRAR
jgi:hypothetical protein